MEHYLIIFMSYDCSRYRPLNIANSAPLRFHCKSPSLYVASIIPDSMVVEDGAEHLSAFSRFLSAPLGKEMAAFPQNYCRPRKKTLRADARSKGVEFF